MLVLSVLDHKFTKQLKRALILYTTRAKTSIIDVTICHPVSNRAHWLHNGRLCLLESDLGKAWLVSHTGFRVRDAFHKEKSAPGRHDSHNTMENTMASVVQSHVTRSIRSTSLSLSVRLLVSTLFRWRESTKQHDKLQFKLVFYNRTMF